MKVQRAQATDVLERDGETAVLVNDVVIRLGELSTVVYRLCEQPVELAHLAGALEAKFGAPVGRSLLDATKDAVAEMIHHGVLSPSD